MNAKLESFQTRAKRLQTRIQARTVTVAVIGLGYVGLPLAELFAKQSFRVIGFDTDSRKIANLERGRSYLGHIPDARISELKTQRFVPTDDSGALAAADAVLICVPTPLTHDGDPDLSFVIAAGQAVAASLRAGQLVVLESSTYPGTTEEVLRPILEATGLQAGSDFFLAYSPEREDPGNTAFTTARIPKVVGGIDPDSHAVATALYAAAFDTVVPVRSVRVAEACKILENTYRAVNIGLVNELKGVFAGLGVDVWEVIEAAKTKPFGFQAFYPGPGLGGHCIPVDPLYLSWAARQHGMTTRFIDLAAEVNRAMPARVVEVVSDALKDDTKPVNGSRVCVLGVAYKKNVGDVRESPSLEIVAELARLGAEVSYSDPHVPRLPAPWDHLGDRVLTPEFLAAQDCILIATDHDAFDMGNILTHATVIVDCRNAVAGKLRTARVYKA